MDPLSKLSVTIKFDLENKSLILTDVLSGGGYTAIGYNDADVKGLFKVYNSSGIIYKNTGWDTDDYSSPDVNGASNLWSITKDLPVDSDNNVVKDVYTIEYKITGDDTGSTTDRFNRYYSFQYTSPTLSITAEKDDTNTLFTVTDKTNYVIKVDDVDTSPVYSVDTTRVIRVIWPVDSGVGDSVTSSDSIIIGPPLKEGSYYITLYVLLTYLLLNDSSNGTLTVYVEGGVNAVNDSVKYNTQCYNKSIIDCQKTLMDKYADAKKYNLSKAKQLFHDINEIAVFYSSYLMAQSVNAATETILEQLKSIMEANGCELTATAVVGFSNCVTANTISNCLTSDEKYKLSQIEEGAEKNVQPNWNETDTASDSYIQNKPSAVIRFPATVTIPASTETQVVHNKELAAIGAVYVDSNGYVQQLLVKDAADLKSVYVYSSIDLTNTKITIIF